MIRRLFFTVILFSILPFISVAQSVDQYGITINVSPKNPRPGDTVTLEARSFRYDLNQGNIAWYVNDKLVSQGKGKGKVEITLGPAGNIYTIDLVYVHQSEGTATAVATIAPADADIVWEADSYVPPFYKGKAIPSSQAEMKIAAIPFFSRTNGARVSSETLIYKWSSENKVLLKQSGYGASTANITSGYPNSRVKVDVEITDSGSSLRTSKYLYIPAVYPEIILYEKRPLGGISYQKALPKEYSPTQKELSLVAEPYYFSFDNKNTNPAEYEWTVNGKKIIPGTRKSEITLAIPQDSGGRADVEIQIRHPQSLLQFFNRSIRIIFGA